ncbi:hypothetical protein PHAMO_320063 [Magnetospirillum molischianum DSM 120]|uniref:Uncharacterized protein n=2 Tax=Magnetospirillum molischianum TaxID=1083 RepID=H8FUQ6_MAGML|nr:hypothetical protein PHAMO_320063 [Magnetospirillum molischianum DSM 120]
MASTTLRTTDKTTLIALARALRDIAHGHNDAGPVLRSLAVSYERMAAGAG